jgi:hypothetical protein
MNHFAIKFAVNARSLCRFGLGLAFVQHQIDRALAQSHVCVSPNAAKIFSLFNPHSPDDALISCAMRICHATPAFPRHQGYKAPSRSAKRPIQHKRLPAITRCPHMTTPWRPQLEFSREPHGLGVVRSTRVGQPRVDRVNKRPELRRLCLDIDPHGELAERSAARRPD